MSINLSRPRSILAKVAHDLERLRAEQRGTVAVIMAFLFPILIAGFGLGMGGYELVFDNALNAKRC